MDKATEVLKVLADNFKDKKHDAALSNYFILCNNIKFLNNTLSNYINFLKLFNKDFDKLIDNNKCLNKDCIDDSTTTFYFKILLSRIIKNNMEVIENFYLLTFPDERTRINIENVKVLSKGFKNYNQLVTTTRQLLESIITSSYQILMFDSKELNYQILTSLNSFFKYATKSLKMAVFNDELINILNDFNKLSYKDWKKSNITKCKHGTFGDKINYIFTKLNEGKNNNLQERLNNLYKFSSEFTHIGFVSTFYASTSNSEVIFNDENGPYLISTENYNELKYEILLTALELLYKIYNPCLIEFIKKIFITKVSDNFIHEFNIINEEINNDILSRNNTYYFFITNDYINSNDDIVLECKCGTKNIWFAPRKNNEVICKGCGSNFNFIILEGDPGYILTSNGPVRVLGSSAPVIENISED